MEAVEIKNMIRRMNDEMWNKGNVAVIDEYLAPNYTGHYEKDGSKFGREELKQAILQNRASSPDLHMEVDEIIVEGDRAVYHWTGTVTNAEGKLEKTIGVSFYRFVDGKVVEDRFLSTVVQPEQAGV